MTQALEARVDGRVPAAIVASLLLHVAGAGLWLRMSEKSKAEQVSVITDVDILMAPQAKAQATAAVKPPPPASMKDFLKLALPSIPKTRAPMDIAQPRMEHRLLEIPQMKLEDKGRVREPAKMEALDLGRRNTNLARVEQPLEERHAKAAMDLPKLEEIGTRRAAAKVIQMAALQEENERRLAPQGLSTVAPDLGHRRAPAAAAMLPSEAVTDKPRSTLSKMADMLTSEAQPLVLGGRPMPAKQARSLDQVPPSLPTAEKSQDLRQVKKKAVEIVGPLAHRRVISSAVPEFPQWAKDQGMVEADVSVRFYVDAAGTVLEDMRVERTSGFGRLDRLAMDYLKRWRFEPIDDGSGNQWGVITFRFVLE